MSDWEAGRATDAAIARRVFDLDVRNYPRKGDQVLTQRGTVERPMPYSTNMTWAWVLAEWMKEHGSSFLLDWGEDNGLWECSWITGGDRYTGVSQYPALAICRAALAALEGK